MTSLSLRNRLVVIFLIPTLIIVCLNGLLAYFAMRQGLEDELGQRLKAIGQVAAAELSESFESDQIARLDASKRRVLARLRERLERTRDATGLRRISMITPQGRSLVDTQADVPFGQPVYALEADRFEIQRVIETRAAVDSVLFTGRDGTYHKNGYAPITHDGEVIAVLAVEASAGYFELLTYFASILTVLALLSLALVVAVGTLFARRVTQPLARLVEAASRLGGGDFETPLDSADAERARRGDEIAALACAFEEMRGNILGRDRQMQMMLSGIAHEVRNPLGGMELFCDLLDDDLRDLDAGRERDAMRNKVDKIKRELGYLAKVVTDFLDFARHSPLELERFAAQDFADEVQMLLAGPSDEAGCTLEARVDDDLELTGDRERLRRAVINIVRNAYQACGAGGHVDLRVSREGDRRRIDVRDDGPGIAADKLEDVLTPFFTTKEKGSGLGLSLTRRIIEQHGGEMHIESELGRGTTITFLLPFDPTLAPPEPEVNTIPEGWLG